MKKRFLILLSCLGLCAYTQAQTIMYYYDEAGNRTERMIVYQSFRSATASQEKDTITPGIQELQTNGEQTPGGNENNRYEDNLLSKKVLIYPNPTQGQLAIEIQNYTAGTAGDVSIYTANGVLLQAKEITGSNISLDIGSQPDGMYLLKIKIDDKVSSWKVLKK